MVLITADDENGSSGIIVNAKEIGHIAFGEFKVNNDEEPPTPDMILKSLSKKPHEHSLLYFGGPCQFPGLYFTHGHEEFANATFEDFEEESEFDLGIPKSFNITGEDDSPFFQSEGNDQFLDCNQMITDGIYFGSPAVFCKVLKSEYTKKRFKFFSGHAAWGVGQLQSEIDDGAWTVIENVNPADVFFDEKAVERLIKRNSGKPVVHFDWMEAFKGFDSLRN